MFLCNSSVNSGPNASRFIHFFHFQPFLPFNQGGTGMFLCNSSVHIRVWRLGLKTCQFFQVLNSVSKKFGVTKKSLTQQGMILCNSVNSGQLAIGQILEWLVADFGGARGRDLYTNWCTSAPPSAGLSSISTGEVANYLKSFLKSPWRNRIRRLE